MSKTYKAMDQFENLKFLKSPTADELRRTIEQTFLFVTAILNKDIILLDSLLNEKFIYFDSKSKRQTLQYFKKQFSMMIPKELYSREVETLYCKGCRPGNPVLLFHHGYWPVLENEDNVPKSLLLSITTGMISDLTLCFGFCNANMLHEIAIQN
jgi:hypothetical protein